MIKGNCYEIIKIRVCHVNQSESHKGIETLFLVIRLENFEGVFYLFVTLIFRCLVKGLR